MDQENAILILCCKDSKGIVAEVTNFIYKYNGNIVTVDQYTDFDENQFFMRIEWELEGFSLSKDNLRNGAFDSIAQKFKGKYYLYFSKEFPNIALFVTKQDHCLLEILWRYKQNEIKGDIKCIISNHEDLREYADDFNVPYYYIPKNKDNKREAEEKELDILEKHNVSFVVMAKYMQTLSQKFINRFPDKIVNIHHSFLPAFKGAKPYHQAHERGVKLIGATVHYATRDLDRGPIIDQDVIRVSHKDSVEEFVRKGKDLEKLLLIRGIRLHLDRRVLVWKNRTIVLE